MKAQFQVGFGAVDITPSQSVRLAGRYFERQSSGVHDPLLARAMAISNGANRAVLCVVDLSKVPVEMVALTRKLVQEQCGLAAEELVLSAVHTHTGPDLTAEPEYAASLPLKFADAVRHALDDLRPCMLKAGRGQEDTLQHIRRYRMKDGCVETNPGIMNPDILEPLGEPNRDVLALLVSHEGRPTGGVVNFGLHCDCIGGDLISADWTYYLRQAMSREFGHTLNILTPIAAAGDVNHFDVFHPAPVIRGFDLSEQIGNRIAMATMAALDDGKVIEPGPVTALSRTIEAAVRYPTQGELQAARILWAQPAPTDKDFTLDRVEAFRHIRAAAIGRTVQLDVGVVAAGNVAFVALQGEHFSSLSRMIKQASPFEYTFICTMSNGIIGYVPAKENYAEGGYEVTSTVLQPGAGEQMAGTAVELLKEAVKAE
jgi:hypothetical protein